MTDAAKTRLREGASLIEKGELGAACLALSKALDLDPHQIAAHYNIGAVFLTASQPDIALPCLLNAAMLRPGHPQFSIALARAWLDAGHRDRAARTLAHALAALPNDPALRQAGAQCPLDPQADASLAARINAPEAERTFTAAVEAHETSQHETALELATSLVPLHPASPQVWLVVGGAAQALGRGELAEMATRRVIALDPAEAIGWCRLARIMGDAMSRADDVEPLLRNALTQCRDTGMVLTTLCAWLTRRGRPQDSILLATEHLADATQPASLLSARANAHEAAGELDLAEADLRQALALAPADIDTLLAAVSFFDRQTDPAALLELIEAARKAGADLSHPVLSDAEARALDRAGQHADALTRIDQSLGGIGSLDQRRSRLFTRARILDRLGRHEEAFAAAGEANALLEQVWEAGGPYDHEMHVRRGESLRRRLAEEIARGQSANDDPQAGPDNLAFLVGFPRSGTTLLDTVLRAHSKVEVIEEQPILIDALRAVVPGMSGDESNFDEDWLDRLHDTDPDALRESYLDMLARHVGQPLRPDRTYIDKLPLNMHWGPVLHAMFPRAAFILARRHPLDSAISNLLQDYSPHNAMLNMTRLERIDRLYDFSFGFWQEFVDWRKPRHVEVSYEDVVADLEAVMDRVMDKLGLEREAAQSRFFETARARQRIRTPSASQVSRPLYQTSRERWRNYGFALEGEDTARLRDWAHRQGYSHTL